MATLTAVVRLKPDKFKFEDHETRINLRKRDYPCCWIKKSGRYQKKLTACSVGTHDGFFASAAIASTLTRKPWEGLFNPKTKRRMTILISGNGEIARRLNEISSDPNANIIASGSMIYQHIGYAICPHIIAQSVKVITDDELLGALTVKAYS